jgi:hypothetical protein
MGNYGILHRNGQLANLQMLRELNVFSCYKLKSITTVRNFEVTSESKNYASE